MSWNSLIQRVLRAHPGPVTSGPRGHSGKPDDNIPIGIGLSRIRNVDGSHAVANVSKCHRENKGWGEAESDGCRMRGALGTGVACGSRSEEVTQRHGGGGGGVKRRSKQRESAPGARGWRPRRRVQRGGRGAAPPQGAAIHLGVPRVPSPGALSVLSEELCLPGYSGYAGARTGAWREGRPGAAWARAGAGLAEGGGGGFGAVTGKMRIKPSSTREWLRTV